MLGTLTVPHQPSVALCLSVVEELDFKHALVTKGQPSREKHPFAILVHPESFLLQLSIALKSNKIWHLIMLPANL